MQEIKNLLYLLGCIIFCLVYITHILFYKDIKDMKDIMKPNKFKRGGDE